MKLTMDEIMSRVRKTNGLRGRQTIVGVYGDCCDKWIFDSNATGGYGETLTFHYRTDAELLHDIAPEFAVMDYIGDNTYELHN